MARMTIIRDAGERMSTQNMIRGTMLLTVATFLSKFLGMIYVIPFNAIIGTDGGTLYSFAYTPYNILLSISTVGVPLAVSKFVAKYNSLGDYATGLRVYRYGLMMMLGTGIVTFLALFFSAEWFAGLMISSDEASSISVADIAMVLRMISFALIIIPAMSISRGFFQGYHSMGPTAVSTVIEQIVRIIFVLGASYIIIYVMNGEIATAVGFATFAAFIGAVASCLVLAYYWRKRKPYIDQQLRAQTTSYDLPIKSIAKEMIVYAIPFVIVGLATPLYQLVDQFTFERAMRAIGESDVFTIYYAAINLYGHKIILIPVTLATGMSAAIIPALTKSFTENDQAGLSEQINKALQIIVVLVIPACIGLVVLSDVAYGALYGLNNIDLTGHVLAWYGPVALLFALFTVSAAILQGINKQSFAVISLTSGLLVKVIFNMSLIHTFGAKGAVLGTGLAVGVAVVLNLWKMKQSIGFSFKPTLKITVLVLIFSAIMFLAVWLTKFVLGLFLNYSEVHLYTVIVLGLSVLVGAYVYLWLSYKSTLLEKVLGERTNILRKIFR